MKIMEKHNELNPKLWENEELKPKIKNGVLQLVREFQHYIDYKLPIVDIVIVGSNASFNYTNNSDVDVHIVINFDDINDDKELVGRLMDGYKSSFNSKYDITFAGLEVEVYVEDLKTSANSNGIYSVIKDKWIKFPDPIDIPEDIDIDNDVRDVKIECEDALESENLEEITRVINELYYQRKLSLQVNGEYSVGNLVFKHIRSIGLLQKLKDKQTELKSKSLCVEKLER